MPRGGLLHTPVHIGVSLLTVNRTVHVCAEEPARTPTSVSAAAGEPSVASTSTTTPPPDLQQLSIDEKAAPVASAAAAISAGGAAVATEAAADGQAAAAPLPSPKERVVEHVSGGWLTVDLGFVYNR